MVRRETDPELVNRIANSDAVRPFIRLDGEAMDWTPIVTEPATRTGVVVLSNGEDAVAAFEITAPGVYQAHVLFGDTCRGKRAEDAGREMVDWMFEHGGEVVWGDIPRWNRPALSFAHRLGFTRQDTTDDYVAVVELRKAA